MKAIVIHGPCDARFEDVPVKKPESGEVVIKIKSIGLCGTDYELYTNEMVYIKNGMCKLPMIPGHEWSGIITEVGPDVTGFKVGDYVTGECTVSCKHCDFCKSGHENMCVNRTETGVMSRDGGFAEYITFPISALHKFSNLSFDEAALVEPTGVAWSAVKRAQVSSKDNVMVIGPGPIGLQAAQIAKKIWNAKRVILTGTRDERLARAEAFGIDGVINVRKENLAERIRELTDGEMIDAVVESSGGAHCMEDIKEVINPCGRVSMVGFFGNKEAHIDWDSFTTKEISIYGSLGSPAIWDDVIAKMEDGTIEAKSIISHILPLESYEDFMKALNMMVERTDNACKIVIHP